MMPFNSFHGQVAPPGLRPVGPEAVGRKKINMFFTYVLRSIKDNKYYIGHSSDVAKRLAEHNSGKVFSTRRRAPFELLHQQGFSTRNEARWRERKWKTGWGHEQLQKLLSQIRPGSSVGRAED